MEVLHEHEMMGEASEFPEAVSHEVADIAHPRVGRRQVGLIEAIVAAEGLPHVGVYGHRLGVVEREQADAVSKFGADTLEG